MFIIESWFWRGTQSAIFYYISCSPCMDYTHRRKRRREAARHEKTRGDIITTQPGVISQPGPFQTNEAWGEEMVAGPGPPKGWKRDKVIPKTKPKMHTGIRTQTSADASESMGGPGQSTQAFGQSLASVEQRDFEISDTSMKRSQTHGTALSPSATNHTNSSNISPQSSSQESTFDHPIAALVEDTPPTTPSSSPELSKTKRDSTDSRPMGLRKMSNTYVAVKDSLRSSLHPDNWNWKRYEREDENLAGLSERLTRIWDRATGNISSDQAENQSGHPTGRRRAPTNESDRYDYNRARNPEVNELHPPVVSQLPVTREDAAWMLMAPPSRAVMEGKEKPNPEATMRWPLSKIGTTNEEEILRRDSYFARRIDSMEQNAARPASKGKERAHVTDSPYAASNESSTGTEEENEEEHESVPPPVSFPFPQQPDGVITRPATTALLYSEARKSWQTDPASVPVLQMTGDGTHSPSQRWSYSGVWVA